MHLLLWWRDTLFRCSAFLWLRHLMKLESNFLQKPNSTETPSLMTIVSWKWIKQLWQWEWKFHQKGVQINKTTAAWCSVSRGLLRTSLSFQIQNDSGVQIFTAGSEDYRCLTHWMRDIFLHYWQNWVWSLRQKKTESVDTHRLHRYLDWLHTHSHSQVKKQ